MKTVTINLTKDNLEDLIYRSKLDEETLRKIVIIMEETYQDLEFKNDIWYQISMLQILTEDFIREFIDKITLFHLSPDTKLSENFIRGFFEELEIHTIYTNPDLSEEFFDDFQDKIDWNIISYLRSFSEDFIIKHSNKLNLEGVSETGKKSGREWSDVIKLLFEKEGINWS